MMRKVRRAALCLAVLMLLAPQVSAEKLPQSRLTAFFENCVFVGDSITQQFHVYMIKKKNAEEGFSFPVKYFTAQSYMLYTASRKYPTEHGAALTFNGKEMPLCSILEILKPKKAFILLGTNDYAGENIEKYIACCSRLIDLTEAASPETQLVFFSLPPVTRSFCKRKDYRTMWDEYNAALQQECERRQAGYIDIATPLKDEEGYLPDAYSSDGKYHLSSAGLEIWFQRLMEYAQEQYDRGLWTPVEETSHE